MRQGVWAATHGLCTRANGDIAIAQQDGLRGRNNGLQPRAAESVDVECRRFNWNSGLNGRQSAQVGVARLSSNDIANHHVSDLLWRNLVSRQHGLQYFAGEGGNRHIFQSTAETANGGARGADNPDFPLRHTYPNKDPESGTRPMQATRRNLQIQSPSGPIKQGLCPAAGNSLSKTLADRAPARQ